MASTEAVKSRVSIATLLGRYQRLILAFPETDIDIQRLIVKHATAAQHGKVFMQRVVTAAEILKVARASALPYVSEIYITSVSKLRTVDIAVLGRVFGGPILEIVPGLGIEHQIRVFHIPDVGVRPETLVLPETVPGTSQPLQEGNWISSGRAPNPTTPKPAVALFGQQPVRNSKQVTDLAADLVQALEEPGVIIASTSKLRTVLAVLRDQVGVA